VWIPKRTLIIFTRSQFARLVVKLRSKSSAPPRTWRDDTDSQNARIRVKVGGRGTKTRLERLPLLPPLRALLAMMPKIQGVPKVLALRQYRNGLRSACDDLDLPRFTHHSLRRFFVSNAIEAGVDFKTIPAWAGHSDGGMLAAKTYGHLRREHSEAMAQRMTFNTAPKPPVQP